MTFDAMLAQVLDLLQRQGRVSYRALKRRFGLDDAYLEDLKVEIIKAQRLAIALAARLDPEELREVVRAYQVVGFDTADFQEARALLQELP